jgi:hypothetical protein
MSAMARVAPFASVSTGRAGDIEVARRREAVTDNRVPRSTPAALQPGSATNEL